MFQHDKTFTVVTVSQELTNVMKNNIEMAQAVGVNYLWVKHITDSNSTSIGKLQNQEVDQSEIFLIEFKTKSAEDFYNSAILYQAAITFLNSGKGDWFFWIDSDELIEYRMIVGLKNTLKSLNKKTVYGVPRLWVKNFENRWFSSGIARSNKSEFDLQYRIFNPSGIKPDYGLHKNFKVKKFKQLEYFGDILHLIYEIEQLEDRCNKIAYYESIEEGSGLSKLRYYLPEVFSKAKINWTEVSKEQKDILNKLVL